MGIVDVARLYAPRAPTECRVTLGAVHLITPVNLEYKSCTLGAVARVLGEQLGRGHVSGIARVWRVLVLALHLVALWTRPVVTDATLPSRAQKPTTVGKGTRAHELTLLLLDQTTV